MAICSWLLVAIVVFIPGTLADADSNNSSAIGDLLGDPHFQVWATLFDTAGYSSQQEAQHRYGIYLQNRDFVNQLNAQNLGFKVALNKFADRSQEEMKVLSGLRLSEDEDLLTIEDTSSTKPYKTTTEHQESSTTAKQQKSTPTTTHHKSSTPTKHRKTTPATSTSTTSTTMVPSKMTTTAEPTNATTTISPAVFVSAPSSVDWRTKGAVTPVKEQGTCGSCWMFAATGALEGRLQIKTGELNILSEQNLLDCAKAGSCKGGAFNNAFHYVQKVGGLNAEDDYPYKGASGKCKFNKGTAISLPLATPAVKHVAANEAALIQALQKGPVAISFDSSQQSFSLYSNGIYSDSSCQTATAKLTHAMLLVGYGNGFWIVKNSWGTGWGEQGYMRVARGKNTCGILSFVSYPVL